jgi:hypothetical protein
MVNEKTLVLIKPDGVQRSLVGKITSRFEDAGLKIVAMKMFHASQELAQKHYPLDEEWAKNVYNKTLKSYQKDGKEMKYKDHLDLGKTVQSNHRINRTKTSSSRNYKRRFCFYRILCLRRQKRQNDKKSHPRLRFSRNSKKRNRNLVLS